CARDGADRNFAVVIADW
nr:immunoglobulin heavy chain junction region [Macaca mulatta]MOY24492.1 immunoglobulin heavy chain junction region [Macaca mulatta]MOY26184.1 immunoglobulin heavy chain junction region [Macaca mulatta]MOY26935.1 immunoglobulin heavy chain junction region [Macaca mulatta]MOY27473.1 immunoglobulin heavy chain junction region [Macaca mulatta]